MGHIEQLCGCVRWPPAAQPNVRSMQCTTAVKIKFAAYHIVTKILRTFAYIYFIISDWIII